MICNYLSDLRVDIQLFVDIIASSSKSVCSILQNCLQNLQINIQYLLNKSLQNFLFIALLP